MPVGKQQTGVLDMAPNTVTRQASPTVTSRDYRQRLNDALEEAGAPLRSGGPGLLRIFGLIVKEVFNPEPPVERSEPAEPKRPEAPELVR